MSFQYCRTARRRLHWWYEAEARPAILRLPVSMVPTPFRATWVVGREDREDLGDPGGEMGRAKGLQGSRRRTRGRNSNLTASQEGRDEGRYEAKETFHRSSAVWP
jgi:hypothetical protein